jgi:hypothetical protein
MRIELIDVSILAVNTREFYVSGNGDIRIGACGDDMIVGKVVEARIGARYLAEVGNVWWQVEQRDGAWSECTVGAVDDDREVAAWRALADCLRIGINEYMRHINQDDIAFELLYDLAGGIATVLDETDNESGSFFELIWRIDRDARRVISGQY